MALNYPGPYEVRFFYDCTPSGQVTLDHTLRLSCDVSGTEPDPGTDFADIDLVTRAGGTSGLDTEVDSLVTLWRGIYGAECNMNYAELWKYDEGTFDANFVSTYDIGLAGQNASPGTSISAYQEIYVFRTQEGGTMKVYLQETKQSRGVPIAYADLDAVRQAFVLEFTSTGNVWLARDTSYPFAFTKMFPGENEALFKRRFRP